jgi:hypothetical protein
MVAWCHPRDFAQHRRIAIHVQGLLFGKALVDGPQFVE